MVNKLIKLLRCPKCGAPIVIAKAKAGLAERHFAYCQECKEEHGWQIDWITKELEWK